MKWRHGEANIIFGEIQILIKIGLQGQIVYVDRA
jgi:hypothetical protein